MQIRCIIANLTLTSNPLLKLISVYDQLLKVKVKNPTTDYFSSRSSSLFSYPSIFKRSVDVSNVLKFSGIIIEKLSITSTTRRMIFTFEK